MDKETHEEVLQTGVTLLCVVGAIFGAFCGFHVAVHRMDLWLNVLFRVGTSQEDTGSPLIALIMLAIAAISGMIFGGLWGGSVSWLIGSTIKAKLVRK